MTLRLGNDQYAVQEVYEWHAKMCACGAEFAASIEGTYWEKLWDKTHADHNRDYWAACKAGGCDICNGPEYQNPSKGGSE